MLLKFIFNVLIYVLENLSVKEPLLESSGSLIVNTSTGLVRGKLNQYKNIIYYSYQGIPYAESPIGDLRFMPPVPKKPWHDIRDATREGPVCVQWEKIYKKSQMSEDCLFLHIYVPAQRTRSLLPILVFVHGGAFRYGSGNSDYLCGPELLLQQDIIVITFNFRVGVAGFLSLDIPEASGNAGLKDVLLALKWIQLNLERFGGDINRVTLSGQSSGASMVHYLLLTKQTTGLFHRAIIMSGSATAHRSLSRYCKDTTLLLTKGLGLTGNESKILLEKLKKINIFDLEDTNTHLSHIYLNSFKPTSMFVPCVEINTSHALLISNPRDKIKTGIPQNIPIMAGMTAAEALHLLEHIIEHKEENIKHLKNPQELIPSDIEYPQNSARAKSLGDLIKSHYFRNTMNLNANDTVSFVTDSYFAYAIDSWIKLHIDNKNNNKLYYYVFNFDGNLNWEKVQNNITEPGACHADDLGYLFRTNATKSKLEHLDSKSYRTMNIMLKLHANFVKYGNPTPGGINKDFKWPEYDVEQNILMITDNPYVTNRSNISGLKRLNFWYSVYDEYYQYVEQGGVLENKYIP